MHSARRRRRHRGVYTVEYVLVLIVLIPVVLAAGEFGRVSLCDQALARATHRAAVAAGRDPSDCETRAREAFEGDALARWLFDTDDNGRIAFGAGDGQEVRLDIAADNGDLTDGVDFDQPLCGDAGSWIRVQTSVTVRARFGLGDILRREASWALNQDPRP